MDKEIALHAARHWELAAEVREIRLKRVGFLGKIRRFLWRPTFEVLGIYRWIMWTISDLENIYLPVPIRRDEIRPSELPIKYQLQNGWTIPKDDLKFLKSGPLVSQNGYQVLVPADSLLKRTTRLVTLLAPLISIAAGLTTLYSNRAPIIVLFHTLLGAP